MSAMERTCSKLANPGPAEPRSANGNTATVGSPGRGAVTITGSDTSRSPARAVSRVVPDSDLLAEARKVAEDIASCVPGTVKIYKKLVDDGLNSTLAAGMEMEKLVMGYANKGVDGGTIGQRRKKVQERGKSQL